MPQTWPPSNPARLQVKDMRLGHGLDSIKANCVVPGQPPVRATPDRHNDDGSQVEFLEACCVLGLAHAQRFREWCTPFTKFQDDAFGAD